MREPVKGRSEAGLRRQSRALATRARIVEAGRRLFERDGYVGTAVTAIAAEAGVAPATVYQAFGTKLAILMRALDLAIADDREPAGLLDRPWLEQARNTASPYRRLVLMVTHTSEIAARTAALKRAMRDAAGTDPDVRDLITQDHERRLVTQRAVVDIVIADATLRPGLDPDQAVASYFALVNSDCYLLMVETLRWDLSRWQRWLIEVLAREYFAGEESP